MKWLHTSRFAVVLLLLLLVVIAGLFLRRNPKQQVAENKAVKPSIANDWQPPHESTIPNNEEGNLIRYGRELIAHTATYLGPRGKVAQISNGLNCQNCHIAAGTQPFGNSFAAVAATYPRYRNRSGRLESIEFRINDCLLRSLNGRTLDSTSREMRAMVSYLKWLGKEVPKDVKPKGAGVVVPPFLVRAADPERGRKVYGQICQPCHGANGEGVLNGDSTAFVYPPLWGKNSYNTGAGLYRLSHFAGYVKNNMPLGVTHQNPLLTDEQAWDVAAFVNAQPRPHKVFASDWPDISKKPVDFPFGPYSDSFSEEQHKFGPFAPIAKSRKP